MAVGFEELRYECDGTDMHGRVYQDSSRPGPRPGVLVFPDFHGLGEQVYTSAARLAELGYTAMACDLHGEAWCSKTGISDELKQRAETLFTNKPRIRAIGSTALKILAAHPAVDASRMASIGYCFGGQITLELAFEGAPLAAAVAFHPSLEGVSSENAANVRGRLLLCVGTEDPVATAEMRATFEANLKGSGVRWQMNLYGPVLHGFTNPHSPSPPELVRYDEWAARDSWNAMTALMAEVIG